MPLQYKLEYIHSLLIERNGVKKQVADRLGKDPSNMKKYWRLMQKAGMLDENFKLIAHKDNGVEHNG